MAEPDEIRDVFLEITEEVLQAQLRAVRRLRKPDAEPEAHEPRMSQMDVVEDILKRAGGPLHISAIIERAQQQFQIALDRESVVSALAKRVSRGDRFVRTAPNTFDVRKD